MSNMTLDERIKNFNVKYSVSLNPRAIAEAARIDAVFDDFTFDKKDEKTTQAATYWKALTETLEKSLDTKTKIQAGAFYDLSDLNLVSFIREFEAIMSQSNEQSSTRRERKPFEGMSFDDMLKKLKATTATYDKPLYSIWANKIVDGKLSYKDLKKVTKEAIERIGRAEKYANGTVNREDLANVVYAHEAMFRVRQSRGFWWKFFHLYQNSQENKYLEALSDRITEYTQKNYPIWAISDEMPDSMMKAVYDNTDSTLRYEDEKRIQEKIEKQQQAEDEKNRAISSVFEQLQPVVDDYSFKDKLTDNVVKNLPKGQWGATTQKTIMKTGVTKALIDEAKKANKIFDAGVRNGKNAQQQMERNVQLVFAKAFELAPTLGYNLPNDQLLAAQKITDVVLKMASPATLKPEEYETFTNGYVLNNPDKFEEITGMDGTENAFVEARDAFEKMNRESVQVDGLNAPKQEIVAPVKEQPTVSQPTIKIN